MIPTIFGYTGDPTHNLFMVLAAGIAIASAGYIALWASRIAEADEDFVRREIKLGWKFLAGSMIVFLLGSFIVLPLLAVTAVASVLFILWGLIKSIWLLRK